MNKLLVLVLLCLVSSNADEKEKRWESSYWIGEQIQFDVTLWEKVKKGIDNLLSKER